MNTLLELSHLHVELPIDGQMEPVVEDVNLTVAAGEAVGLVGESGSGKSMTARAVARLLPPRAHMTGEIRFAGESVTGMDDRALRRYRGEQLSMVFQDPRVAINPVHTIEDFLTEALVINRRLSRADARARAITVLGDVGIEDAPRRMRQHPYELSGGLLQRVMIASALLTDPRLLIADEPTTALDVITQEDVMAILDDLRRERSLSLLFITHDLDLAAAVCDRTAVMYGGRIVEIRGARLLHADPLHPYSAALAESRPDVEAALPRLTAIRGRPQSAYQAPRGCPFAPRCDHVEPACADWTPTLTQLDDGQVACRRARELRGTLLTAKQVPTSA